MARGRFGSAMGAVLVAFLLLGVGACNGETPVTEGEDDAAAKIVLEDIHTAIWMVGDNNCVDPAPPDQSIGRTNCETG